MGLTFVNLILAPLAVLVLAPVLVHLFARSRPPRYAFSSLDFLRRVIRQTMRVRRPRDWIVLLLRTLLAATLIALFLRPLFRFPASGSPFEQRNVVVIIDRSASMAALAGGRSRFAAACAEASELLTGLDRRTAANIVWMDASPDPVFPELGPNIPYLLAQARSASVSFEAADIDTAIELAVAMLRRTEGIREIDVVSDFQAAAWKDIRLPDLEGASLVAVSVGGEPTANTALTDLTLSPAEPLPGETVRISCSVWNYGGSPVHPALYLDAGEARQSRELFLPPWSRTVAQFETVFSREGQVAITAECSEDDFAADNARHAIARVRPHLQAAVVGPRNPTSLVWERALRALGLFDVELHASLSSWDGTGDALLVSGWTGEQPERLRQAARQGTVVLCFPSPDMTPGALNALCSAALPSAPPESPALPGPVRSSTPVRLNLAAPDDPLFSLFSLGAYGDPSRGLFHSVMPLPPLPPDAVILLAYDTGTPALARLGRDPLYLWNLDLDPAAADWTQQSAFLPLFGELFLGRRNRESGAGGSVPGIPVPLDLPPGTWVDFQATTSSGAGPRLLPGSPDTPIRILPDSPGILEWRSRDPKRNEWIAVNLPTVESDLRSLPEAVLREQISSTLVSGRQARHLREGVECWHWLLGLAVVWALLEGAALAFWEGRR